MKENLTNKQKVFCQEYIVDNNGMRAAIVAGYSKKSARVIASENLTKLNVKNEIARLQKKNIEKIEVTVEEILTELKRIAFDLQDSEVNMREKLRAIEMLGKHLGMFVERREIEFNAKIDQRIVKIDIDAEELVKMYLDGEK